MANAYEITSSSSYHGRTMTLYLSQSQNIGENKSTIYWTLHTEGGTAARYATGPTEVWIDGNQVYYCGRQNTNDFPSAAGDYSGSLDVWHNSDGTKSISVSLSTAIYTAAVSTDSGTWILDTIPRYSNITAAPNFNDEENPTITFTNPSNGYFALRAKIEAGGNSQLITRDLANNATECTFYLSEAERNTLRSLCYNSNTLGVRFTICCVDGSTEFSASYLDKTMTIVNANPTLTPTVVDTNSTTTALTGDSSKLVKYYSNARFSIAAAAYKSASISSYRTTNGNNVSTASSGTFNAIENNTFNFQVSDSRGNITSTTLTPTMVNYIKLTNNLSVNINISGEAKLTISGNYFNGSFGSTSNTLTISYRYKTQDGSYGSWQTATVTKNNDSYTATPTITGLDYQHTYVFQARAVDKLNTIYSSEITAKALPVFDWSKNDFNINVDFKIKNKSFLDLIYPVGSVYITTAAVNPAYIFGGTWERITGRFLLGADDGTYRNGNTGGEATHTLTVNEIPSHNHWFQRDTGDETEWISPTCDTAEENVWGNEFSTPGGWSAPPRRYKIKDTGGNGAHNNMPPYFVVFMWRRIPAPPTISVEAFGTGYGFSINSNGYYESTNKGQDNSWSLCKVRISAEAATTLTIQYINSGENGWDFGLFSNLNVELADNRDVDTTGVYKSCKNESSTDVKTLTYDIPAGNNFITIKFRKDGSTHQGNDSLQFRFA